MSAANPTLSERLIFPLLDWCFWLHGHRRLRLLATFTVLSVAFTVEHYIHWWATIITLIYGTLIGYTAAAYHFAHFDDPTTKEGP